VNIALYLRISAANRAIFRILRPRGRLGGAWPSLDRRVWTSRWIKNLAQVPGEVQRGAQVPRGAEKSGKILTIPQQLALRWGVGYALSRNEREENIMTIEQSTSFFLDTAREAIRVRH